uniref:HECT domain-containing protein n=1 Tax=Mesocestoides corti TaxID=53468 RepID=A0A5K3FJS8_MESCO
MSEYVCEQFVRRYLMSHNYTRTWAILDIESSSDNLNGCFQPSKIVECMNRAITTLDHEDLGKIWKGLEDCFLSRLDQLHLAKFESLKGYTYKTLLCEAIKCNEVVSINSFFNNQKIFDLSSPSWAQWLALPFIKEPQKHHFFGRYFTKTWVDVLFTSLSNFLCVLFSSLPILSKLEDQEDIAPTAKTSRTTRPQPTLDDFADLPSARIVKQR